MKPSTWKIVARACALALLLSLTAQSVSASTQSYPQTFKLSDVKTADATIHVRVGGQGPAVLMLHGFGDSGDMWQPLAVRLMGSHTIVVPDLRGMGLSSHPDSGYDKKAQAQELARVLDSLSIGPVVLVTHDIGNMVGYAFAAQYRKRVTRWIVMDAPLPGIGEIWDAQYRNPKTWHFNFRGPDVERLVAGRERILLDRFYNELSATPAAIDEQTRQHYAQLYALPRAMHDAFEQFAAFTQDGLDNRLFVAEGKLTIPVLAIGADQSYGTVQGDVMRLVAEDVTSAVIANSGHWIMEEQPAQAVNVITTFVGKK